MLRDLVSSNRRAQEGSHPESAARALAHRERPRLLVMHQGDPRLAALEQVLGELGYRCTVVGTPEEVVATIQRGPAPDVLLTACSPYSARRGLAFPRECLARWPALRALYFCFIPQRLPEMLEGRERVLAAPFNASELTAALDALAEPVTAP
jgi:CheY-like chemotaxis protein